MNHDDLSALQAALQVSATAILQSALQISSDAKATLSEVLITEEGLADKAAQVLATLLHEAAHSVAWQRSIKDTSRQGRYHNRRFQMVAEEVGLQVQRDSAFGWTRTSLLTSTAAAYSGVLSELELCVPRARSRSATGGQQRPRAGVRTLTCQCGDRLVRDRGSGLLAEATICSGCLTDGTRRSP
jgi:SprT-like family